MSEPRPVPPSPPREAFLRLLKDKERRNWEDRIFYLPKDIRIWMHAKSAGETVTNVVRLVSSFYDGFPKIQAEKCTKHLLVLAALLHPAVNCGHLIHIFVQYNFTDEHLSSAYPTSFYDPIVQELREGCLPLPSNYKQYDYRAVINSFDRIRWAFCPAPLTLHMNNAFTSGSSILPFLRGDVINKKGGTANVRHYKILEEFVDSEELKKELASSRHEDPLFGWCYEFAVKSYLTGWEDIYKLESEAFRGVRNHKGVVKYLGEYHFREVGHTSPKHNILLEYGQQDLDEYIADTYPPVLNAEILAFWGDLFEVAATLKRLHQFQYKSEDGRTEYYKGWHGDIKPDNILRVRGEFKLADFGFTKFEKDEIGRTSTLIVGGTRTYGAPECDRQRSGTSTPHLQTIDTWSFGCVLSAVATWVILGSQAYDNYRQVRMLEIEQLRKNISEGKGGSAPSGDDAFHDGTKVLSSVLHWHNFLRNSCRKSDTISQRVLDLVEQSMLVQDPQRRMSFVLLCEELEGIIVLAKDKYRRLGEMGDIKTVAPDTLEALLQLDNRAPATATPIAKVSVAKSSGHSSGNGSGSLLPNDPSQSRLQSERVRKSERQVVIGKTANRDRAIRNDLGLGIVSEAQEICDSPQQVAADDENATFEPFSSSKHGQDSPTVRIEVKDSSVPLIKLTQETPTTPHAEKFTPVSGRDRARPQEESQQSYFPSDSSSKTKNTSNILPTGGTQQALPNLQTKGKGKEVENWNENFTQDEESSSATQSHELPASTTSEVKQSFIKSAANDNDAYPAQRSDQQAQATPTPPPAQQQIPGIGPEIVSDDDAPRISLTETFRINPILEELGRLERLWGDKKGTWLTHWSKIPEDPWLKNFISNRDIVFVADNAFSMREHWAIATTVLTTLAMKIGPLDKDGLDLVYTIGSSHNLEDVEGWDIPKKFKDSMQAAVEDVNEMYKTNMAETLERIFDSYTNTRKRMTLIVLTDGIWEGCVNDDDVEKLIADFITKLKPKLKKWESR